MKRIILGVDPGETVGVAKITYDTISRKMSLLDYTQLSPNIKKVGSLKEWNWSSVVPALENNIFSEESDIIVVEDYRIRQDAALAHSNQRVLTSEFIGALETLACLREKVVTRIQPLSKGLWPDARLRQWMPEYFDLKGYELEHARDAVKLALCYIHYDYIKGGAK